MDSSILRLPSREIVLPGEEIARGHIRTSGWTYRRGESIRSAVVGVVQRKNGYVSVIPLKGVYFPVANDMVIGTVDSLSGDSWLLDIGAVSLAQLPAAEVPWKVDIKNMLEYLSPGEVVIARVKSVEENGRITLTMKGSGLKKVRGGTLMEVPPMKVPRVIGRNGSMIRMIKNNTGCQILIGKNGVVWINGPDSGVKRASEAVELINMGAHKVGLTGHITSYLKESRKKDKNNRRKKE